jgi:flavin reductase (DIM6/NTAB) family NADH-FMN oxidoreductase RutF
MEPARQVLQKFLSGVYLLTCCKGEEINGMPVSWVSQISFDPQLIMVAVHKDRYSHNMIKSSGSFALNLLRKDQREIMDQFMKKGMAKGEKFKGIHFERGITGTPLLLDTIGFVECKVISSYQPGDHTLFIARVIKACWHRDASMLSSEDYGGAYAG